jgi:hypothetical protein
VESEREDSDYSEDDQGADGGGDDGGELLGEGDGEPGLCDSVKFNKMELLTSATKDSVIPVVLGRFEYDVLNRAGRKNMAVVDVGETAEFEFADVDGVLSKKTVQLIGAIVHKGQTIENGHYWAYVCTSAGVWYKCDDSDVTLASKRAVLQDVSKDGYVPFFGGNSLLSAKPAGLPNIGQTCYFNSVIQVLRAVYERQDSQYQTGMECHITGLLNKPRPTREGLKNSLQAIDDTMQVTENSVPVNAASPPEPGVCFFPLEVPHDPAQFLIRLYDSCESGCFKEATQVTTRELLTCSRCKVTRSSTVVIRNQMLVHLTTHFQQNLQDLIQHFRKAEQVSLLPCQNSLL